MLCWSDILGDEDHLGDMDFKQRVLKGITKLKWILVRWIELRNT